MLPKISRAHALYPVLIVLLRLLAACVDDACVVLSSSTLARPPTPRVGVTWVTHLVWQARSFERHDLVYRVLVVGCMVWGFRN